MVAAPQLGGNKNVFSLDFSRSESFLQPLANFLLILVAEGSVNVSVSYRDSMANSPLDLSGTRLPRSCSSQYKLQSRSAESYLPSPRAGISAPVLSLKRVSSTAIVVDSCLQIGRQKSNAIILVAISNVAVYEKQTIRTEGEKYCY